ncbi:MAG: Smr/MutS family protein [Lachnospiraceae bacterium]|nr:Smr/MutS family protein [Lachnospiraceae bacterium]
MEKEEIMERMSFVMHGEYLRRVRVYDNENNEIVIKVDLHGMCRESAQKALNNIIAIIRSPFILDVIHGYNGGTVIKQMIHEYLKNSKIVGHRSPQWNPGETLLLIA